MLKIKGKLTDITESHHKLTHKTTVNIYEYLEIDGVKYGNMQVPDVINRHIVNGVGKYFEFDCLEVKTFNTQKRTIVGVKTEDGKFDHISDAELKPALTAIKAIFALYMGSFSLVWVIVGAILSLLTLHYTKSEFAAWSVFAAGFVVIFMIFNKLKKKAVSPIKAALDYVKEHKTIV